MTGRVGAVAALLLLTAGPAWPDEQRPAAPGLPRRAAPARPPAPARVFIDVSGGVQSNTFAFTDSMREEIFHEIASWTADYGMNGGPAFLVDAGVRVWGPLVARVGYSRVTETRAAAITGSIPHPFFFDRDRRIEGRSLGLKQEEQAFHAGILWLAPLRGRLSVGLFGGPSFVRVTRDLVRTANYEESYPYDEAAFDGAVVDTVEDGRIGFHAGADLTYFFTRALGVGAVLQFSRARVHLASPATGGAIPIDAGGFQAGAGIRLRFGGERGSVRPRPPKRPPALRTVPGATTPPRRGGATDARRADRRPAFGDAHTTSETPVFITPGAARQPLAILPSGTRVRVLDEEGKWLLVEFEDRRWGPRLGWVHSGTTSASGDR